MSQPLNPFTCTYSDSFSSLLHQLKCSLAITTYQAGKLIFISPAAGNKIMQLPRTFQRPMGLSINQNQLALATRSAVTLFTNEPTLNVHYQEKPTGYDAMFAPRVTYHTGPVDLHDIHIHENHLLAVNTAFNCISTITHQESFTPVWKPNFITEIIPEDRCHLNGLAVHNKDWYVTAFNRGNSSGSWRSDILNTGVLMHAQSDAIILENLSIPHSPRIYKDNLYLLLSGKGELIQVNPNNKTYTVISHIPAFIRGLAFISHYAFIGISRPRKSSSTFSKLAEPAHQRNAGIIVVDLNTGNEIASLSYLNSVDEIYDVQLLPEIIRPNILSPEKPEHQMAIVSGGRSWWASEKE